MPVPCIFQTQEEGEKEEEKVLKEDSIDAEEKEEEDESSNTNAEEYDPLEAEDADDDDEDGTYNAMSLSWFIMGLCPGHKLALVLD